jgi:hypothetical protein
MAHTRPVVAPVGASAVQLMPEGRSSVTSMPWVVVVPSLVTVMSNPISSPAFTGPSGFAVLTMSMVAGSTLKHSSSWSVWEVLRYCESAEGMYSARKQYLPAAFLPVPISYGSDVAESLTMSTAPPTCSPLSPSHTG